MQRSENDLPDPIIVERDQCIIEKHWYRNEGLRLAVWIMRPKTAGPYPVLVYNHGSRVGFGTDGELHDTSQQPTITTDTPCYPEVLAPYNWMYVLPEGRGYGGSDGPRLASVINDPAGAIAFLQDRGRDANAAVDWLLKTRSDVEASQVAMAGISHGGVVSLFASAEHAYNGVVLQATGAWYGRIVGEPEMTDAASRIESPILIQHFLTDSLVPVGNSRLIAESARPNNPNVTLREYEGVPSVEGHMIFDRPNQPFWRPEFREFLKDAFETGN